MNTIKEIERINHEELRLGLTNTPASWHHSYLQSATTGAYIFVGGLDTELSEGDVITMFSQYGEVVDLNLIRDPKTGASRGYGFLAYEDTRSTILAVDNMNGSRVMNRMLRVDHAGRYHRPKGSKPQPGNEPEFEVDDDAVYDERRRKIWDYEAYAAPPPAVNQPSQRAGSDVSSQPAAESVEDRQRRRVEEIQRKKQQRWASEQQAAKAAERTNNR